MRSKREAQEEQAQQLSAATDQWNVTGIDPLSGNAAWSSGRANSNTNKQASPWGGWQSRETGTNAAEPTSRSPGLKKVEKEELREIKTRLDAMATRTEDNAAKVLKTNADIAEIKEKMVTKDSLKTEVKRAVASDSNLSRMEKMMEMMMRQQGLELPTGKDGASDADDSPAARGVTRYAISTPSSKTELGEGNDRMEEQEKVEDSDGEERVGSPDHKKGKLGSSPLKGGG